MYQNVVFFLTFITYFHDNTNSLFKHGQNPIQVSLLLQQTGLTDPVFSKLVGQRWQPCQNRLHLVRRAPLQTLVELKKEHLGPPVKVLIKAHLQHTLPIPLQFSPLIFLAFQTNNPSMTSISPRHWSGVQEEKC